MEDPLTTRQAPIFLIDRRATRRTTLRLLELADGHTEAPSCPLSVKGQSQRICLGIWSPLGSEKTSFRRNKPPLPGVHHPSPVSVSLYLSLPVRQSSLTVSQSLSSINPHGLRHSLAQAIAAFSTGKGPKDQGRRRWPLKTGPRWVRAKRLLA